MDEGRMIRPSLLGYFSQEVAFPQDQVFLIAVLVFRTGELGVDYPISFGKLHGNPLAIITRPARAHGYYFPFLGFLLGGVGQDDSSPGSLLLLDGLDDYSFTQWDKIYHFSLLFFYSYQHSAISFRLPLTAEG